MSSFTKHNDKMTKHTQPQHCRPCLTPESSTSWPLSSAKWGLLVSPRSISRAMRAAVSSSMPQLQVRVQHSTAREQQSSKGRGGRQAG